jgi:hypothetical protein
VADPAYPLLPWVIKGYPNDKNAPRCEQVFNYRLSRARVTVENTFGRWKGLTPEENEDTYAQLIRKLDKHFLPRKNKDYARFQFGNLSQQTYENMAQYYYKNS